VGHLLVNVSDTKQPVALPLDMRNAPPSRACDVDIYRCGSGRGFEPLWRSTSLPREFRIELTPLEAVFVEIHSVR
jgi:hypothetical protein